MARPENHQTSKRKLSKVGGKSFAVTLPVDEIDRLGWKKGDDLIVRRLKKQIIIEKDS